MQRKRVSAGVAVALGVGLWLGFPYVASGECRAPVRDDQHRVQIYSWSWKELRQRNVVMQRHDYSCGAAALATILRYYWQDPVGERDVVAVILNMLTNEEILDRVKNGMAISDLRQAAVKMGYQSSIGTMSFADLCGARVPLVVPIRLQEYDHFVVYRGVADGRVYLADPIRGNVRPTVAEFCSQWQKHAVLAVAKPGASLPRCSALSIRPEEVYLGSMTQEFLRKQTPQQLLGTTP